MVVIVGSAIAAGIALTFSVPLAAMNEVLLKRHKAQMKRHLPAFKPRVNFACENEKKAAPELPQPEMKVEKKEKMIVKETVLEVHDNKTVSVECLPPPYKSVLRRPSPPPYDLLIEAPECETKTALPSPSDRPRVRFAQRA